MDPLITFGVRHSPQSSATSSTKARSSSSAMSDLQICKTCGAQHMSSSIEAPKNECPICLDPRQYVPATGQAWLTLADLRSSGKHKNIFHPMDADQTSYAHLIAIRTEPQVAIGQSAYLVRTPEGNVLWDCITYLDDETIEAIKGLGGLKAIAISHPHFYSTNIEWAKAFTCPVYLSAEDQEWRMRKDDSVQTCWIGQTLSLLPKVTVVKVGGHFPGRPAYLSVRLLHSLGCVDLGSAILHWNRSSDNLPSVILTADSIMPVPSGGISVMYSYPNLIGLSPDEMYGVWKAVKDLDFELIYGGWYFVPAIKNGKEAILRSLKQSIRIMTKSEEHPIFSEAL